MPANAPKISRRQALGLAAAGAAGAAGVRVFGLHFGGSDLASSAGPGGAWASPLTDSRARAAHLLRRAGFGYSAADLDRAASMSYSDLVESVITQKPEALPSPKDFGYQAVSLAWMQHMATTAAQFPERMTFFWHGHLTSDYRKAARFPFVYTQNVMYRTHGTGDLRTLLVNTVSDPLMMRYLDLDLSTGASPNENFAREFLELFTLGIGNFNEDDVKGAAKAFAGLRIVMVDPSGKHQKMPTPNIGKNATDRQKALDQYYQQLTQLISQGNTFQGVVQPGRAYTGTISLLGTTAKMTPDDAVDVVLGKPQIATYIATKALAYFATPNASAALVAQVADAFRSSKYDIRTLMRTIFMSDDFTAAANYRSLVRSPVDYSVAIMRALGRTDLAPALIKAGPAMDQILYDMPTVAGWPTNGAWLSSSSVLARLNAAATVAAAGGSLPNPVDAVHDQLDNTVGPDLAAVFNASQNTPDRWYALLASPEFQLK